MKMITCLNQEISSSLWGLLWVKIKAMPQSLKEKVFNTCRTAKKIGQDDPRTVIHSLKVGLALTLVSLFYYYQPLYESFGLSAMWAVMTVVVVFEYSVGATLGKGMNRGLATLLAGALGVGAHYLASLSGQTIEPILLSFFVFLQAAISTFIRFFPKIKARYDYGLLIFILTFSLISVSGFREDEILEMAHKRLSTIFIGGSACVMISIFVCPVWAGEELHNLISLNFEKLANSLQAFEKECFRTSEESESKDNNNNNNNKDLLEEYKSILYSKNSEESLANFARWEPGHGRFQFRHPWDHYLKIGNLIRLCAYRMESLNAHLNSNLQESSGIGRMIMKEVISEMSLECGKALRELGMAVSMMKKSSSAIIHLEKSKDASNTLKALLQSSSCHEQEIHLLSLIPAATVASLLTDIVQFTEEISDSVEELASLTEFEDSNAKSSSNRTSSRSCECAEPVLVVVVADSDPANFPESGKSLSNNSGHQHNTV